MRLQPPLLVDLVDRVNSPAVLSATERYSFNLRELGSALELKSSLPGEVTGRLLDLVARFT